MSDTELNEVAQRAGDHGPPAQAVIAYHRAIDTGRAASGIDWFTPDAVFQAKGQEYVGREGILGFLTDREAQRDRHTLHVITNVTSRLDSEVSAEVSAIILLYVRQTDGNYLLERVLDTTHLLSRGEASWRIHRRRSGPLHPARAT